MNTTTPSCLVGAASSAVPTIQISLNQLANLSSAEPFGGPAWTWPSFLLSTNLLTLLLLPLVIREIPTIMTTTLDPILDYVFDPWSWSYFPVWCAEVWRLVRDEHAAHFAGKPQAHTIDIVFQYGCPMQMHMNFFDLLVGHFPVGGTEID
ncbi:hypothetical protein BKCO1_2400032 [Neofusicoccum parvum]|uniref:Uncharacterized protein n=1 Tax=Neofusicoccum parvum TaxID=310453 RepID=A0ACB5S9Y3_9PEZI|nr:hypothetical protein BKCO1_2400032 [Neofusicoccum parvum]